MFVDNLSRIFERASYEQLAARLGVSSLHLHHLIDSNITDFELVLNIHLSTRVPVRLLALGAHNEAEPINAKLLPPIRTYDYLKGRSFIVAIKQHARCKNYSELAEVFNVSQRVLIDCTTRETTKFEFIVRLALSGLARAESYCEVTVPIVSGNQPYLGEIVAPWGVHIDPMIPPTKRAVRKSTNRQAELESDLLLSDQELEIVRGMFVSGDINQARDTIFRMYKMKIANNSKKSRETLSVLDNERCAIRDK